MTLIRHPQLECEGPGCRVRVKVPVECEAEQEAFLPHGWVRLVFGQDPGDPDFDALDFHTEACALACLAKRAGTGAVSVELDLLRKSVATTQTIDEAQTERDTAFIIGSEAQRKMDERSKSSGIIDHMFNGDPEDPLVCRTCGGDHLGRDES